MGKLLSTIARLDRVLTTQLVWPTVRNRATDGAVAIPLLMYHSISPDLDSKRAPYYRTVTSPETFAAHLRFLKSAGFTAVTLSQAVEMLRERQPMTPGRLPVVITFDDGLEDFYSNAFPLLEAEGMTAIVFLSSQFIGGTFPTGHACLSSSQIGELAKRGVEFGSHSATHVLLVEQTIERLERELADSKTAIEQIIGREVALFSFPYRFPVEQPEFVGYLHERLLANGYHAGVTTLVGRATANTNLMFLPRLPINDCDDSAFFRAKLFGAYDWFGGVQHVYKTWRSRFSNTRAWSRP
jgi:peptidoglycan/xylan/chitin deacetylase (PgdA/CDA1 family)